MNAKDAKIQTDLFYAQEVAKFQIECYSLKQIENEIAEAVKDGSYSLLIEFETLSAFSKGAISLIIQLFENHFSGLGYNAEITKPYINGMGHYTKYTLLISWNSIK